MDINALKTMLAQGQDNLLLRFGLGQAMLKQGEAEQAIEHLHWNLTRSIPPPGNYSARPMANAGNSRRPDRRLNRVYRWRKPAATSRRQRK